MPVIAISLRGSGDEAGVASHARPLGLLRRYMEPRHNVPATLHVGPTFSCKRSSPASERLFVDLSTPYRSSLVATLENKVESETTPDRQASASYSSITNYQLERLKEMFNNGLQKVRNA